MNPQQYNQNSNNAQNGNYNNGNFGSFDEMNQNFLNSQRNEYEGSYYNNSYQYQNNNRYNEYVNKNNITSSPKKKNHWKKKVTISIIVLLVFTLCSVVGIKIYKSINKKNRTVLIYMVGSNLESDSKQGTYSIADIDAEKIDLKNTNVIMMAGGAKVWHNDTVKADKIGIYELTKDGFVLKKSYPLENMGSSKVLEKFLDYSYNTYPSEKFDLVFWNHGLGSIGLEHDEISKDFLSIKELDDAFKNSKFKNKKLELTIFFNCLSSNFQIAKVMKNYSEYMVASEEILYMAKVLNRFGFLSEIKEDDSGYDIAHKFIKQSNKVVSEYNGTHTKKIDSTLSILDLSKIDELDENLNEFFNSIDVDDNYMNIANIRRNLYTYGKVQTSDYDLVDLYSLIEGLIPLSNNKQKFNDLLDSIKDTVVYTSSLNNYSNGLSIYLPYYGSGSVVENHLNVFKSIWNDSYLSFIDNFYEIRNGINRSRRENNLDNKLKNNIDYNNNFISLSLTNDELKNFRNANIYIFSKNDNEKYELLLKKNELELENNNLIVDNTSLLQVNKNYVTLEYDNDYKIYGKFIDKNNKIDVINYLSVGPDKVNIVESILKSDGLVSSGILDHNDYESLSISKYTYDLLEDNKLNEYWKDTLKVENITADFNDFDITYVNNDLSNYYVLIEVYDINNDVFYSELKEIKR